MNFKKCYVIYVTGNMSNQSFDKTTVSGSEIYLVFWPVIDIDLRMF